MSFQSNQKKENYETKNEAKMKQEHKNAAAYNKEANSDAKDAEGDANMHLLTQLVNTLKLIQLLTQRCSHWRKDAGTNTNDEVNDAKMHLVIQRCSLCQMWSD